jgi:hypothetical protein
MLIVFNQAIEFPFSAILSTLDAGERAYLGHTPPQNDLSEPFSPSNVKIRYLMSLLPVRDLNRVAGENRGDVSESSVKPGGQRLHACGCAERYQGDSKGILDQVLALIVAHQVLELHVKIEIHGIHHCPPRKNHTFLDAHNQGWHHYSNQVNSTLVVNLDFGNVYGE